MKKLALMFIGALLLQSCATYRVMSSGEQSRYKSDLQFKDEIVSIAKPKTPIQGYEDAVVFLGKNHTFLVQERPNTAFAPVNFNKIFQHADLNHLYIDNNPSLGLDNFVKSVHQGVIPKPKEIELDNLLSSNEHTHSFYLTFIKPVNQLQKGEKETMQNLGMSCYDTYEPYPQYLVCYRSLNAKFTLVQNPTNAQQSKYGLKQPLTVGVYKVTEIQGSGKANYILLPLAVAFDIVTFPVQYIMLSNADWR